MTDEPVPLRDEFWVISTKASTYIVTEETALAVVSAHRSGVELIEIENLAGNRAWLERRSIESIEESTPSVREWHRRHNAAMKAEKKAAGHFEDDE